ncbi:hypothetical protein STM14_4163 [Salmonella enterica subsp. enterica serovar Typhimurium str. 14028S]|uniref:Uncharacterized protein n=2 Tax=Salmonella enterica I TaxID=59201 RepID=A0A0F6B7Q6_SALT1|nr:hypothetical protein SPAB_04302 [Salmonella enterica subsp. enterica serovar Paratyphi B str. SPB7]ACY90554.1 hypothetical protein STM14_4163 [Salmonella enterica subsp. enterica serovar Typhimurium str. 14028S]
MSLTKGGLNDFVYRCCFELPLRSSAAVRPNITLS